jgi:hypothetical protein
VKRHGSATLVATSPCNFQRWSKHGGKTEARPDYIASPLTDLGKLAQVPDLKPILVGIYQAKQLKDKASSRENVSTTAI